jgi:DNA-binding NtrC family response regulator
LNTFTIRIPPLRERPEDIFELADHFLREYNRTYRLKRRLAPGALKSLQSHSFPGNVRELKNLLKQAVLFCETEMIDDLLIGGAGKGAALPGGRAGEASRPKSLTGEIDALEKQILENALLSCKTTRELARQLGISQPTVVRKLRKHGLSRRLMH